ncbi:flagellar assembly protein FliX [Falsiroseomonas bella]|uniref:flagellar assembly protein FliX n=1 Tax=Falsiroseomonas bella TaxID=2184016 RepID=UPI001304E888|nr:flagellar assembly protein FliX [Falsiroseomonas bella]
MRGIGGVFAAGVAAARRGARPGSGFALPEARSAASTATSASAGVAALLAVQDESAGSRGRRQAPLQRAALALEELRGLQLDLLRGGDDPARLARLEALAEASEEATEPALRSLLAHVRLRARVELARRHAQKAGAAPP